MIPSAKETRSKTESGSAYINDQERIKAISYLLKDIEKAQERGLTYTSFSVPSKHEEEIKRLFLSKGYMFKPTGYIGGVWQLTERIHW